MREREEKCVTIDDLDHAAVLAMIKFMYTGSLDVELANDDTTVSLMKAAHKYQVATLVDICIDTLSSGLTDEVAVKRLMLADLIGSDPLQRKCLAFITSS